MPRYTGKKKWGGPKKQSPIRDGVERGRTVLKGGRCNSPGGKKKTFSIASKNLKEGGDEGFGCQTKHTVFTSKSGIAIVRGSKKRTFNQKKQNPRGREEKDLLVDGKWHTGAGKKL